MKKDGGFLKTVLVGAAGSVIAGLILYYIGVGGTYDHRSISTHISSTSSVVGQSDSSLMRQQKILEEKRIEKERLQMQRLEKERELEKLKQKRLDEERKNSGKEARITLWSSSKEDKQNAPALDNLKREIEGSYIINGTNGKSAIIKVRVISDTMIKVYFKDQWDDYYRDSPNTYYNKYGTQCAFINGQMIILYNGLYFYLQRI